MVNVLRRFIQGDLDPLGLESTTHGDGWIGSLRWRKNELAPVASFVPWQYTILLDGVVPSQAYELAWALHNHLRFEPSIRTPSKIHKAVRTVGKSLLLFREFHSASPTQSEVQGMRKDKWRSDEVLRYALGEAKLLEKTVEFAYESRRKNPDGVLVNEIHNHRVLIRETYADGFRGEHSRGIRDYKFSNLKWLTIQEVSFGIQPTQMLRLSLELSPRAYGGAVLITRHGTLGRDGILESEGVPASLEDITNKLTVAP
jgi:hypothetical protein